MCSCLKWLSTRYILLSNTFTIMFHNFLGKESERSYLRNLLSFADFSFWISFQILRIFYWTKWNTLIPETPERYLKGVKEVLKYFQCNEELMLLQFESVIKSAYKQFCYQTARWNHNIIIWRSIKITIIQINFTIRKCHYSVLKYEANC